MEMTGPLPDSIFDIRDTGTFSSAAMEIFRYQAAENLVYSGFVSALGINPAEITDIRKIPFLPVEFFKKHRVVTGSPGIGTIFESSRTTGNEPGRHYVSDPELYHKSCLAGFRHFYGEPSGYVITALLPSYRERPNSSLVTMTEGLIRESGCAESGFYEGRMEELAAILEKKRTDGRKRFLIGVSYALIDLATGFSPDLSGVIVMETGGMKGRRKEITRDELHHILASGLRVDVIHSEYGMTELLSQAYSRGNGIFMCPPWMKILVRDLHDPLDVGDDAGRTGGVNIIDLANYHSCSFLAAGDYGKLHGGGSFSISGRIDNTDIRGCNLMTLHDDFL
jgi:hypothetical protein